MTGNHTFIVLLFLPSSKEIDTSMVPHWRLNKSLNAKRFPLSYNFKSCMHRLNLMKTIRYIKSHDFLSSMRIPDLEWLFMEEVTTRGRVTLRVTSTFSWSRNPIISLYSYVLIIVDDFNEVHDRTTFLLEDLIPSDSTTKVGDDHGVGEAISLLAVESKAIFFVLV